MDKNKLRGILEKNIELIDHSLAQFLIHCSKDAWDEQVFYDMSRLLYKSVVPEFGGIKNIFDIVINDEKYFKWDSLDRYNLEHGRQGKGDHYWLSTLYDSVMYRSNSEDKEIMPDVDFTTDITLSHFKRKIPCIEGLYQYSEGPKCPKDLCAGVIVSRSVYPDANASAVNDPHNVIVFTERKPLGKSWVSVYPTRSDYVSAGTASWVDLEYDDPGLIYVPIKNKLYSAIKEVLPSRFKPGMTYNTCLPKDILNKYNFPILEG